MYNSLKYINLVSIWLGQAAMLLTCLLVCSMLYEVAARYIFHAPTLWAFDLSYMLNGSIFLLAGAYSLHHEAHVRIDFCRVSFLFAFSKASMGLYMHL